KLLLAVEQITQRFPFHERHHVIEVTSRAARVVQRQDVRMLQLGRDLDLALEPLQTDDCRHGGMQHLDGHEALVFQVLGQEHRGHPPAPQLTLKRVAIAEVLGQRGEEWRNRARVGQSKSAERATRSPLDVWWCAKRLRTRLTTGSRRWGDPGMDAEREALR